jgi:TROVE domain
MAKYNTGSARRIVRSPVKSVASPAARTYEGHAGYVPDAQSELYRLGVNLFAGGENTYYESGKNRDTRFSDLVSQLAVEDPGFVGGFLPWLRHQGNIRTASQLGAVSAVHARVSAKAPEHAQGINSGNVGFNRGILRRVTSRLDEVPEQFAIWGAEYGKPFPSALKRAAGDSLNRLLNPYSLMKYDTDSHGWRIGDVVELAHLKPSSPEQAELFALAIANRRGNKYDLNSEIVPMIAANRELRAQAVNDPSVLLNTAFLKAAGMTWEDTLSLAGNRVDKGKLWDALIQSDSVGYMAMLRNLRNFQEAGISRQSEMTVLEKLSDPEQVAKSRQFPYRFWSAYKSATGTQWAHALEQAVNLCAGNVPELDGETIVLIDTSGSMGATLSGKSSIRCDEAAALFGAITAVRNPGKVAMYMYADHIAPVRPEQIRRGESVLRLTHDVVRQNGKVGFGTQTAMAVAHALREVPNAKRVLIFTDGQSFGTYGRIEDQVPADVHLYAWNLGGYRVTDTPSGSNRRHQLAGLTDGTFKMIPLLERGRDAGWPWEDRNR